MYAVQQAFGEIIFYGKIEHATSRVVTFRPNVDVPIVAPPASEQAPAGGGGDRRPESPPAMATFGGRLPLCYRLGP